MILTKVVWGRKTFLEPLVTLECSKVDTSAAASGGGRAKPWQ